MNAALVTHSHVAVLCVGLVRGLRDPSHRQNMRDLLASIGPPAHISVFAFLEAQSLRNETMADDGRCTQAQLDSLIDEIFHGYTTHLQMANLRERARAFPQVPLAFARHYKTARAVEMMTHAEQQRGSTYDWVLSLRIDIVAVDAKPGWLQQSMEAVRAAPSGTVLAYQDFVWFSDRPTALRMSGSWESMIHDRVRSRGHGGKVAIDRCHYANSTWARHCSVFTAVVSSNHLSSADLGHVASPSADLGHVASPSADLGHVASPSADLGHVASPSADLGHVASPCSSGDIEIDASTGNPMVAFGLFMLSRHASLMPQCFMPRTLHWRLWPLETELRALSGGRGQQEEPPGSQGSERTKRTHGFGNATDAAAALLKAQSQSRATHEWRHASKC